MPIREQYVTQPVGIKPDLHYRPEIQGLRAVAVLMVVVYHVWIGRVSGGVDVFLFISAFLLTSQFIRRHDAGRTVNLVQHWLHVFKRLLPAAAVVLGATLAGGAFLLTEVRWNQLIEHVLASLGYVQNWVLANEAVDYFAQNKGDASPLQHFWSLSIQGQVFILWPLIMVAASWASRRWGLAYRATLWSGFGLVFASSLAFSVWETATHQAFAYFDTRARLWEFALGSLLALVLSHVTLPRVARALLGWAGILGVLTCGVVLQVQQQFPGFAALWPTLSASAVIIAGSTGTGWGVDRHLSSRWAAWLGGISYGLYLWHWPILVIYLAQTGQDRPDFVSGAGIISLSIVLAWITTLFVEAPVRRWKAADRGYGMPLLVIAVCAALVAVPSIVWQVHLKTQAAVAEQVGGDDYPGALSMDGAATPPNLRLRPELSALGDQWPRFLHCIDDNDADIHQCDNGVSSPEKTIVLVGSSHTYMWSTPFLTMAAAHHWRVESVYRGYCPLTEGADQWVDPACADWASRQVQRIVAERPDMVVTTSTRASYSDSVTEYLDPAWAQVVQRFVGAGISVTAIRDTPRLELAAGMAGPDCVAAHRADPSVCGIDQSLVLDDADPTLALHDAMLGVHFLDFTDYFCRGGWCPSVIGNVVVYLDVSHVTRAYLDTLTPVVERRFLDAAGWS